MTGLFDSYQSSFEEILEQHIDPPIFIKIINYEFILSEFG